MSSHKTVIVDEIFQMLEAAKSSIVPGSVCQSIVSAVQNVPAAIKQDSVGGSSGSSYMTFPLSPIVKNCCLDKTYLNLEFDVNFNMVLKGLTASKHYQIPFYFGFRDSFSLFNQIQFLIENSCIWQTTYAREESVNSYNSLPETEIRGNPQYSSIDKMRNGVKSTMKRIILDFTTLSSQTVRTERVSIKFNMTVDINRLSPIFSNLSFTTPHMGNLRLKVFMQDIERSMFFCPDYSWFGFTKIAGAAPTQAETLSAQNQPFYNQFWSFYPLSGNINEKTEITAAKIPFYAYSITDGAVVVLTSVTFTNPEAVAEKENEQNELDKAMFMTFENGNAEIVQTNFDIYDDDYRRLTDHFASLGSVIIPTQTWSTGVFNNSNISKGGSWNRTMIGTVGGYSVDLIGVWSHPENVPCYFCNEFLNDIQLLLEGRPINAVSYSFFNDKFITDSTQAIIDTDHEEINKDYVDSLSFLNISDTSTYLPIGKSVVDYYNITVAGGKAGTTLRKGYLSYPGTTAMYFSTNLPDCFRSGACNLENTNRQAMLRLLSNKSAIGSTEPTAAPLYYNLSTSAVTVGFSCLCDCVIVLNYDATRGTCFDGSLSWAAPYI